MLWRADIVGIMVSSIGAFIGLGAFFYSWWSNNKMTTRVDNVEGKIEFSACWEDLKSPEWKRWLGEWQRQAMEDGLIDIKIDRRRRITTYKPLEAGYNLLRGELMEKIAKYICENASIDIRTLILDRLGRRYLLEKVKEKKVDIKILIAVIAAYFD